MSETDLEQLIADWYRRLGSDEAPLGLTPTAECPPLTLLWRHVAEGQSLEQHEHHVGQCERCRRLCEIIEREHERTSVPVALAARRTLRRVYAAGGLLAAAACLALIFVGWPQPSFDAEVAAFFEQAGGLVSPVRGEAETGRSGGHAGQLPEEDGRSGQQTRHLPWITTVLNEPAAQDALAVHAETERTNLYELSRGHLLIDADGRLAIADGVHEDDVQGLGLTKLVEDDHAACQAIVDALVRHLPDAPERHRPALRRALDRWRAENVFGVD